MKEIGIMATVITILTIYVMIKDHKRTVKYEAWKRKNNLSDEECGI